MKEYSFILRREILSTYLEFYNDSPNILEFVPETVLERLRIGFQLPLSE